MTAPGETPLTEPAEPNYEPAPEPDYEPSEEPSYEPNREPDYEPSEEPAYEPSPDPDREPARERRPWIERIGLAGIAAVLATLFGAVAAAAWSGGEPFVAAMGAIGCLMTLWVGVLTLMRG